MPKTQFNKIEKAIIKVLAQHRGELSIKEIANRAGVSWVTARKYLKKLAAEGIVGHIDGE